MFIPFSLKISSLLFLFSVYLISLVFFLTLSLISHSLFSITSLFLYIFLLSYFSINHYFSSLLSLKKSISFSFLIPFSLKKSSLLFLFFSPSILFLSYYNSLSSFFSLISYSLSLLRYFSDFSAVIDVMIFCRISFLLIFFRIYLFIFIKEMGKWISFQVR